MSCLYSLNLSKILLSQTLFVTRSIIFRSNNLKMKWHLDFLTLSGYKLYRENCVFVLLTVVDDDTGNIIAFTFERVDAMSEPHNPSIFSSIQGQSHWPSSTHTKGHSWGQDGKCMVVFTVEAKWTVQGKVYWVVWWSVQYSVLYYGLYTTI